MSESFVDQFEKELFTDEERELEDQEKWSKYYDEKSEQFLPPYTLKAIDEDKEKQIYRLHICHYAYWMVISVLSPFEKPRIKDDITPESHCYACEYAFNRCNYCPIDWNKNGLKKCKDSYQSLYYLWASALSQKDASCYAKEMALIPWRK